MDIAERKRLRFEVLRVMYGATDGRVNAYLEETRLLEHMAADRDEFHNAVDYLVRERLLGRHGTNSITITHEGVNEVEQAHDYPDVPTEHFVPANFTFVNTMIGSSIQQGSNGATQGSALTPLACARTLLAALDAPSSIPEPDLRHLKSLAVPLAERLRSLIDS